MELDNKIYEKIEGLSDEGNELIDDDRYDEAINKFNAALDLIPQPKHDWEASTWLYASIGDAYYLKEDYKKAKEYFYNAMNCPDGVDNPFILLRLGESLFECEGFEKAKEYLLRAFMLEGYKIFRDEDKKYFNLIKGLI
ncbi:hypothetical protein [Pelosinus sp. IPA-1]|uniref:tetratricopeptide repeat protein n=1 Tax=Pelosinus sp. IPA-1 TaxID=3029569 RepID=UPI00243623BB|nr:hypothetical protein [Pelosinus sp. IPA-1]GMA98789.1 hypothetical protein PIPA1_15890 [Pelosinus sp. IPA-1]